MSRLAKQDAAESVHPERRRLAPNVICMFDEDRPAVANRRKGRIPHSVAKISSRRRLRVGLVVELCGYLMPSNHGKKVVIEYASERGFDWWVVQAVSADIDTHDEDTDEPTGSTKWAVIRGDCLRRIWTGTTAQGTRQ